MSNILTCTIGLKNIHKMHNTYFLMRLRTFLVFKYNSLLFYLIIVQNKIYVKLY